MYIYNYLGHKPQPRCLAHPGFTARPASMVHLAGDCENFSSLAKNTFCTFGWGRKHFRFFWRPPIEHNPPKTPDRANKAMTKLPG